MLFVMVISSLIGVVKALFHCGFFAGSAALGLCVICAVWGLMLPRFRPASLQYFFVFTLFSLFLLTFPRFNASILRPNRKFRVLFWVITAKTIADGAGAEQSAAPGCCAHAAGRKINPGTPNFNTKP